MPRRSQRILILGLAALAIGVLGMLLVVPALASGPTTVTSTTSGLTGTAAMMGRPVAPSFRRFLVAAILAIPIILTSYPRLVPFLVIRA